MTLPLEGKRVLVTRAAQQAGKLSAGLRELGVVPIEVPVLEIVPPQDYAPLDNALHNLSTYDWLVLTSANTVRVLVERAGILGVSFQNKKVSGDSTESPADSRRALDGLVGSSALQVAVVGQATAEAARKTNLTITVVPDQYVAESLIASMSKLGLQGKKILLARAVLARDVIPDSLREAGAVVDVVDAYRNRLPESAVGLLRSALEMGFDAATFTSSSSATHLREAALAAGLDWPFAGVAAVSIGPVTSKTLRELGWEPAAEASPYDIPGLLAAVEKVLAGAEP